MEAFVLEGAEELRHKIDGLLSSNPENEKRIQQIIRKALMQATRQLRREAQANMQSDPREAYRAVRSVVYKQVLGGNVNILRPRKAGKPSSYEPERNPSPRGGNRRQRSARTQQLMSYGGSDRGFILRFINSGTGLRKIKFNNDPHRGQINKGARGGNTEKYGQTVNTGSRGSIAARDWFGSASHASIEAAAEEVVKLVDDMLSRALG